MNKKAIPNKEALLRKFRGLKTFVERLNFWEQDLKIPYLDFLTNTDAYKEYKIFRLDQFKEDWKLLNKWILENYEDYIDNLENNEYVKSWRYIPLLSFRDLKAELIEKLKKADDEEALLNEELETIGNWVKSILGLKSTYQFDLNSYNDFFLRGRSPNYSKIPPSIETIRVENGKILAQYSKFVSRTLEKKTRQNLANLYTDDSIPHSQLAIILKYIGLLDFIKGSGLLKARVFSFITVRGRKRLYDAIRKVNSASLEDLKAALALMLENGLIRYTYQLKKDIEKKMLK